MYATTEIVRLSKDCESGKKQAKFYLPHVEDYLLIESTTMTLAYINQHWVIKT
jgi:hypothetical protein